MSDAPVNEVAEEAPMQGWCFLCNRTIDGDMGDHAAQDHPSTSRKMKAAKISWEHRLANDITLLEKIAVEPDRGLQIQEIDEVLQDLYLVRAKLAQEKGTPVMRVEEGS